MSSGRTNDWLRILHAVPKESWQRNSHGTHVLRVHVLHVGFAQPQHLIIIFVCIFPYTDYSSDQLDLRWPTSTTYGIIHGLFI